MLSSGTQAALSFLSHNAEFWTTARRHHVPSTHSPGNAPGSLPLFLIVLVLNPFCCHLEKL